MILNECLLHLLVSNEKLHNKNRETDKQKDERTTATDLLTPDIKIHLSYEGERATVYGARSAVQ